MVLEEVSPSITLHAALDAQASSMAASKGMTKADFLSGEKRRMELESQTLAKDGKLPAGISSSTYANYIFFLNTTRLLTNTGKYAWNATLGRVLPKFATQPAAVVEIAPLNAAKLIDDLLYVHGHEILIDGESIFSRTKTRTCLKIN